MPSSPDRSTTTPTIATSASSPHKLELIGKIASESAMMSLFIFTSLSLTYLAWALSKNVSEGDDPLSMYVAMCLAPVLTLWLLTGKAIAHSDIKKNFEKLTSSSPKSLENTSTTPLSHLPPELQNASHIFKQEAMALLSVRLAYLLENSDSSQINQLIDSTYATAAADFCRNEAEWWFAQILATDREKNRSAAKLLVKELAAKLVLSDQNFNNPSDLAAEQITETTPVDYDWLRDWLTWAQDELVLHEQLLQADEVDDQTLAAIFPIFLQSSALAESTIPAEEQNFG